MSTKLFLPHTFNWIFPEYRRWWLRFNCGVHWGRRNLLKRRVFISFNRLKPIEKVKFGERFGTPRKSKAFDHYRLPKKFHHNKFHFSKLFG